MIALSTSRHLTAEWQCTRCGATNRKFVAADVAWEAERLTSLMRDPDSSFGGLLFFYDSDGERHIANVYGTIVPTFVPSTTTPCPTATPHPARKSRFGSTPTTLR